MKIVINKCHGSFGLSDMAKERYIEISGSVPDSWHNLDRADKYLVQVVEELGALANGDYAFLKVYNIEAGTWFAIADYDGLETIKYRDNDFKWIFATD